MMPQLYIPVLHKMHDVDALFSDVKFASYTVFATSTTELLFVCVAWRLSVSLWR